METNIKKGQKKKRDTPVPILGGCTGYAKGSAWPSGHGNHITNSIGTNKNRDY